jgi:hypothetical protein
VTLNRPEPCVYHTEYCRSNAIEDLDRDEYQRIAGTHVKNRSHWQNARGDQQQRFPSP